MNILISYIIIHCFVTRCLSIPTNTRSVKELSIYTTSSLKIQENTVVRKIKELEQQKDGLFREINKAMEESVAALKNSNVTNAEQGVSYIEDLKMQINNIANANGNQIYDYDTDSDNGSTTIANHDNNSIDADTRRKNNKHGKHYKNDKINVIKHIKQVFRVDDDSEKAIRYKKKATKAEWTPQSNTIRRDDKFLINAQNEIDRLLNKGLYGSRLKDRMERRLKMQEQLDQWVKMREEERKTVKAYREMVKIKHGNKETCPRRGFGPLVTLPSFEHTTHPNARYPCCRKCCKDSYLGCLK